jgi:hypothetical protein
LVTFNGLGCNGNNRGSLVTLNNNTIDSEVPDNPNNGEIPSSNNSEVPDNQNICDVRPPATFMTADGLVISGTSWRLNKLTAYKNYRLYAEVEYLERNVTFTFKENNDLLVAGLPDETFVFERLTNGEHLYAFFKDEDTKNGILKIHDTTNRIEGGNDICGEEINYKVLNDDGAMLLLGNCWEGEGDARGFRTFYTWVRTFTKM